MGSLTLITRIAALMVLHAAGGGIVLPGALFTRSRDVPQLPTDNQTLYTVAVSEILSLDLSPSSLTRQQLFLTVSPCVTDFQWAFYRGPIDLSSDDSQLELLHEETGGEMGVFTTTTIPHMRYVLQMSSNSGGGVAVSARGEEERTVRLRLRMRSRRRVVASWEQSPVDPKSMTYCIVVSKLRNYTSLCAAQTDAISRERNLQSPFVFEEYSNIVALPESGESESVSSSFEENQIDYNYMRDFRSVHGRKRKQSTDPEVACIGTKTHYNIYGLDLSKRYFVSVFAVGRDRLSGALLAVNSINPKNSTGKLLKENVPYKADISEKTTFFFKAYEGAEAGIWVALKTCGAADLEVLFRGKRLVMNRNIGPYTKIFVPAPRGSAESSPMFRWSSEERRLRFVIKVTPARTLTEEAVGIEITVSTTRWGIDMPELQDEGQVVRELRPRRSCQSIDVAFLPAVHNATDVIRYCITAREYQADSKYCLWKSNSDENVQCVQHIQRPPARVLIHTMTGLKPGQKYSIEVTASCKSGPVPYNVLYAETNPTCKNNSFGY